MARSGICAAIACLVLASTASAQTAPKPSETVTIIHAGTLLAVPGEAPKSRQTIVIRGDRIAEVRDGFVTQPDAKVIDLSQAFVLPGLIDMHVHLDGEFGPQVELEPVKLSEGDAALQAAMHADRTLQAGFTTVRNLGGTAGIRALRDAAAKGRIAAPTIVDAGPGVAITAGHMDVHGYNEPVTTVLRGDDGNRCDGADDCARATREVIGRGADVIKIAATGGVLSNVAGGLGQQMSDAEIKSVVDTARGFGRKVAAHAHAKAGIDAALRAGVDSIEHGSFIDAQSVALFKKSGAYLVPTLLAPDFIVSRMDALGLPAPSVQKAREAAKVAFDNTRMAIGQGVKIAFGTDSGVSPHGSNAREFKLLVNAGMKPAEAIRSATRNAADLLGRSDSLGTVEAGKQADIIAVASSPLADIGELERVRFVMARGIVHRMNGERQAFAPK